MPKYESDNKRCPSVPHGTAHSPVSRGQTARDLRNTAATVAVIAAAVALLDVALIPGVIIGGASVLAPKYFQKLMRQARQRSPASPASTLGRPIKAVASPVGPSIAGIPRAAVPRLAIGQALVKTITFRIIVTTLDFSANYIIIGELAAAAGLSGFSLIVGPFFYFVHETGWNYLAASAEHKSGRWGDNIILPLGLPFSTGATPPQARRRAFTVNLPLAKTITFRTFATTMDFTANYVVVGDFATAAALSAFGFVVGPFVYLGHEIVWDWYKSQKQPEQDLIEMLPAWPSA